MLGVYTANPKVMKRIEKAKCQFYWIYSYTRKMGLPSETFFLLLILPRMHAHNNVGLHLELDQQR